MIKVYLHDGLKKLLEPHDLEDHIEIDVDTPRDAVKFLSSVLPGFEKEIKKGGYFLSLSEAREFLSHELQNVYFGRRKQLHIMQSIVGAKSGGGDAGIAPESSNYEGRDKEDVSALFNGAVNTTEQGLPVPIIYGEIAAGTAVISAGISSERFAPSGTYTVPVLYD